MNSLTTEWAPLAPNQKNAMSFSALTSWPRTCRCGLIDLRLAGMVLVGRGPEGILDLMVGYVVRDGSERPHPGEAM